MSDERKDTEKGIRSAYPGAFYAVVLHELDGTVWKLIRTAVRRPDAPSDPIEAALQMLRLGYEEGVKGGGKLANSEMGRLIRSQMDHPDFRRYVAAKLGMM